MRLVLSFYLFHLLLFWKVKPTLLLFLAEAYWFYVLNVMRIAMLSVLMYHFPGQVSFLHGVFPSVYLWSCFHLVGNLGL
jgi:exosortase/archaeosortase family protein